MSADCTLMPQMPLQEFAQTFLKAVPRRLAQEKELRPCHQNANSHIEHKDRLAETKHQGIMSSSMISAWGRLEVSTFESFAHLFHHVKNKTPLAALQNDLPKIPTYPNCTKINAKQEP